MKHLPKSLLLISAVCAISTAQAQISLVDTLAATSEVDGLSYTIDGSALGFTGASKLVVTVGSEGNSGNGASPANIDTISYGGIDLVQAGTGSNGRANIWYADLEGETAVGTDFLLDFITGGETNRGYGFTAYTLSGTKTGVSSTGVSNNGTGSHELTSISPTSAGEFLVASFSRNSAIEGTTTPIINTAGLTELVTDGSDLLDGQYTATSIYGTLASAGTQNIDIGNMNSSGATVIATFAAVPEPSTLALIGLCGLTLLTIRRRQSK